MVHAVDRFFLCLMRMMCVQDLLSRLFWECRLPSACSAMSFCASCHCQRGQGGGAPSTSTITAQASAEPCLEGPSYSNSWYSPACTPTLATCLPARSSAKRLDWLKPDQPPQSRNPCNMRGEFNLHPEDGVARTSRHSISPGAASTEARQKPVRPSSRRSICDVGRAMRG